MRTRFIGLLAIAMASLAACTDDKPQARPTASASTTTAPATTPPPIEFDVDRVRADIEYLAEDIGPRHATSRAYVRAADWVSKRFASLGYEVELMNVDVPAGNSWGVDVAAGNSPNVIAQSPDFDPTRPHVIVGAHLDTVPVAPGAEDNASGVSVMLELARDVAAEDTPIRFIAFGAEEPRGPGDDLHHFGSQAYVRSLNSAERDGMKAMVSLDRVGVRGPAVPLCTGGLGTRAIRNELRDVARRLDVPHTLCANNRASDHWSFERNDLPSARVGSLPYAGYHSARDVPSVVSANQLKRVGEIMLAWLRMR